MRRLIDAVLGLIFVPKCRHCRKRLRSDTADVLCEDCRVQWEKEKSGLCPTCGQHIRDCWCGIYDDRKRVIEREIHLSPYYKGRDSVAKSLVLCSKYRNDAMLFDMLANELAALVDRDIPTEELMLVYVPRSKARIRKFGCDQGEELCKRLSRITGIEMCDFIYRTGSKQQKMLTFHQREENARHSFDEAREKRDELKGKHIILVDDLVTSGATVTRCATLIKRARVKSVTVLAVAKTAY